MSAAADAAGRAAEAVRELNHLTHPMTSYPGLRHPADAHEVLGALSRAVAGVVQAGEQLAAYLRARLDRAEIVDHSGKYTDPREAVDVAADALADAAHLIGLVVAELDRAHEATAGLAAREGG